MCPQCGSSLVFHNKYVQIDASSYKIKNVDAYDICMSFFSENEKIHPSGLPTIGLDFGDNCMGVAHFSTFLDLIDDLLRKFCCFSLKKTAENFRM